MRSTPGKNSRYIKAGELLATIVGKINSEKLIGGFSCLHDMARSNDARILSVAPDLHPDELNRLRAVFDLSSVLLSEKISPNTVIKSASDAAKLVREEFRLASVEKVLSINLNSGRRVISVETIASGTAFKASFDLRELFFRAMNAGAAYVILAHNHPSGNPSPSQEDIKTTEEIVQAAKHLRIPVLDHIVMSTPAKKGESDFRSMRVLNLLDFS